MVAIMRNTTIIKIGAIISNQSGQILAVHKRGKPKHELIVPGGKQHPHETDEQTLRRELFEELAVDLHSYDAFGQFEDMAIYENAWLIMRVYKVTIKGMPQPSNEIDQLVWLDSDYQQTDYQFASILGKQILPRFFNEEGHND